MALTSFNLQDVLTLGGLDDADAYLLFRLDSEAQLRERVTAEMAISEAYIAVKVPTYYVSADASTQTLLGRAACYLTLQQLVESLKSRKIEGTQWALDQEDSSRFQALVDVEYEAQAMKLLNLFGADESGQPIMLPGLVVGNELATSAQTPETRQGLLLDDIRGLLNNPNWIWP